MCHLNLTVSEMLRLIAGWLLVRSSVLIPAERPRPQWFGGHLWCYWVSACRMSFSVPQLQAAAKQA
jgi:hypothetical protein